MDSYFLHGFLKAAQSDIPEIAQPEPQETDTVVTCLSDCSYAQNPERRCMLEGISLSVDEKSGTLLCGQYTQEQVSAQTE